MTDTPCPPEFVAAEAWKVLLRPRAVPPHPGQVDASGETDTAKRQETSFWEAAWSAR